MEKYQNYSSSDSVLNLCIKLLIHFRDHDFDKAENGRATARRKSCKISLPDQPAHGENGVRQYHKKDDSKILAFKRRGLSDIPS